MDHKDSGWPARTNGFETVADRIVEKLELEGGEVISFGRHIQNGQGLYQQSGQQKNEQGAVGGED